MKQLGDPITGEGTFHDPGLRIAQFAVAGHRVGATGWKRRRPFLIVRRKKKRK